MYSGEICHHGIKGMKWGVRRYQNKDGSLIKAGRKRKDLPETTPTTKSSTATRSVKDFSDDELRARINRLELEKRYKDLSSKDEQKKTSRGKDFVMDVLEKSGKNIATQTTTWLMGEFVNKVAGADIVNPKKGQKDK